MLIGKMFQTKYLYAELVYVNRSSLSFSLMLITAYFFAPLLSKQRLVHLLIKIDGSGLLFLHPSLVFPFHRLHPDATSYKTVSVLFSLHKPLMIPFHLQTLYGDLQNGNINNSRHCKNFFHKLGTTTS